MCLACTNLGAQTKEQKQNIFEYSRDKSYIFAYNNKRFKLNDAQIDEIIEHALCVISTGVDLSCDIWAIQWPNDYIPKTIK